MKNFINILVLIILTSCDFGRHERVYEEVGLVSGSVIWADLKIAIPCLVLGVLLILMGLILESKIKKGFIIFMVGISSLIGVILILVGLYHLIFLWAWIEYIIMYAFIFILVIGIIASFFGKK